MCELLIKSAFTIAVNSIPQSEFVDVISINQYHAWYQDAGHPETIYAGLTDNLHMWYTTHAKPMLITEYGAGAVAGLHKVGLSHPLDALILQTSLIK